MKKALGVLVVGFCSLQSVPITLPPAMELLRKFDERLPELKTFMREWGICEKIGEKSMELGHLATLFSYGALDFAVGTNMQQIVLGVADYSPEAFAHAMGGAVGGLVGGLVMESNAASPRVMPRLHQLRTLLNNASAIVSIFGGSPQWPVQDINEFYQGCKNVLSFVDDVATRVLMLVKALCDNPDICAMRDSDFIGGKNPFKK